MRHLTELAEGLQLGERVRHDRGQVLSAWLADQRPDLDQHLSVS